MMTRPPPLLRGSVSSMKLELPNEVRTDNASLTTKQESFCLSYVQENNLLLAYRLTHDTSGMTTKTIYEASSRLKAEVKIAARIKQLRDIAAMEAITTVVELMRTWHDIAIADPNEIISRVAWNCRFCHGVDHHYQWINDAEYYAACAVAALAEPPKPLPDVHGGYGFVGNADPNVRCPACFGEGLQHTRIADTTKLVGPARKLYAGIKETANGIEVKLQDQQKARESLARCLGAFKDAGLAVPVLPTGTEAIPANASPQDAAKAYLRLVN